MVRDIKLKALSATFASETRKKFASVKSTLSRWTNREGMPCRRAHRVPYFNVEECRAWIVANKPGWFPQVVPLQPAPAEQPSAKPEGPDERDKPLIEIIRNPESSHVEKIRASNQIAMNKLALATERGEVGVKHFSDLERVSKELRQAEADHIENARRLGELIPRAASLATLGDVVLLLITCKDSFVAALGPQVEIWQTDEFRALDPEARLREARQWAEDKFRDVTALTSAEIRRLLDERLKGGEA